MCGVIGAVGLENTAETLVDALRRLEYRGYDSAGIALVDNGAITRWRAQGKIANLAAALAAHPAHGTTGIGHTRWATHGAPSERNAHPHLAGGVAAAHNGIIENYQTLKEELQAEGVIFESDTDSEVVPRLVQRLMERGMTPEEAVLACVRRLEGAYALAFIFADRPDLLIGARRGSPLAVGYADGAMLLGSDALALAPFCSAVSYLEEGDVAVLTKDAARFLDGDGRPAARPREAIADEAVAEKGDHPHFMHKEMHEQPRVLAATMAAFFDSAAGRFRSLDLPFPAKKLARVTMAACGTSYYATLVARLWFERYAGVPAETDIASEFRYRRPLLPKNGLALFVSQSGETADTLAALRYCKEAGQHTIALVNAPASTMAREADAALLTRAGPEIGVASTKAFTTQLIALACLAATLGRERGFLTEAAYNELAHAIGEAPDLADAVLRLEPEIRALAATLAQTSDMFYMGRGGAFAIAHEGALKMKEISYIHAEAYAAGELKHGPLALISDDVPVVVIAPPDELFAKTASNLQETVARGGRVILLGDRQGIAALRGAASGTIEIPRSHPIIAPILYTIPLQLLAYHVAVLRGADVDQPRNLAKSVTVE